METLFRAFLLKELHGWDHETALCTYLEERPSLRRRLGFETLPDQSTLWRSWHSRFTTDLQEFVATAARTTLIKADTAGVSIPQEPSRKLPHRGEDGETGDERSASELHRELTPHVSQVVYPAFSLDRGTGCEIHENAFWVSRPTSD